MRVRAFRLILLGVWIGLIWAALSIWTPTARDSASTGTGVPVTQMGWADFFTRAVLPTLPIAEELQSPLRPPDAQGVRVTLAFLEQDHLGEDWAVAPGDGSAGEPVEALGPGWVSDAQDYQGAWGKVVFIVYRMPENRWPPFLEVMCAELGEIDVKAGDFVKGGQKIGTVGSAGGLYKAHLHWEVRETVGLGLGAGFNPRHEGWLEPSDTLRAHRGSRAEHPLLMQLLDPKNRQNWGSE